MKKYIAIALLMVLGTAYPAYARWSVGTAGGGAAAAPACADTSCTGFLICQNFQTAITGYDNSESWSENIPAGGTVEAADTTATVLRGTQQLNIVGGTSSASYTTSPAFSEAADVWVHFRFLAVDATPSAEQSILEAYNGGTKVFYLGLRTDGKIRAYSGTGYTTSASALVADSTAYHVWLHYVAGSGADGTIDLYWGTTTSRPESVTVAVTNGSITVGPTTIRPVQQAGGTAIFFDQFLVDDAEIGTVCD